MKLSSQIQNQSKLDLLNRAKRGDPGARKKLRQMGLLYWEHQGRVIVRRLWERTAEELSQARYYFPRFSHYPR